MKPILQVPSIFIILLLLLLVVVYPAQAHGTEPRLEISVERMNPGGIVDLRGVDFESEEVIALMLVSSQTTIALGEVAADVEGTFLQIVALPVDLPEGTYAFQATTDDHKILSPELTVQGLPVIETEEGQRSEEDGLLAPMPTMLPGAPTLTLASAPTPTASMPASTFNLNYAMLAFVGLIGIGGIALLSFMRRRRA